MCVPQRDDVLRRATRDFDFSATELARRDASQWDRRGSKILVWEVLGDRPGGASFCGLPPPNSGKSKRIQSYLLVGRYSPVAEVDARSLDVTKQSKTDRDKMRRAD